MVFLECATPPHVHQTSRYVIACHQFTRPSLASVQQATNARVRRPGYEAKPTIFQFTGKLSLHLVRKV